MLNLPSFYFPCLVFVTFFVCSLPIYFWIGFLLTFILVFFFLVIYMYVNLCVDMCTWVQKRALDLEWVMGIKFRPLPEQCACFHWRVSPVPFHFPPCLCFHWLIFIECNGGFRLYIFTHVFRSYSYFSTPLPQSSPQTLALCAELTHANSLCRYSLVLVLLTWTSLHLRDSFGVCRAVFSRELILRQACMLGTVLQRVCTHPTCVVPLHSLHPCVSYQLCSVLSQRLCLKETES